MAAPTKQNVRARRKTKRQSYDIYAVVKVFVIMSVNITDIFKYVGDRIRPLSEGEAVLNAGHETLCGIKKETSDTGPPELIALCLQTSNLNAAPHKINILLEKAVDNWVVKCSCKAGEGGYCKHVIAVLLFANRSKNLEELSCTDLEQVWGQSGPGSSSKPDHDYGLAIPLAEFCHVKPKRKVLLPSMPLDAAYERIFNTFIDCLPESSLSHQVSGRANRQPPVELNNSIELKLIKEFVNSNNKNLLNETDALMLISSCNQDEINFYYETISTADTLNICLQTANQSTLNKIWLRERQLRITGTSSYSLYTYHIGSKQDREKKISNIVFPKFSGNWCTKYGKNNEKCAKEAYEKHIKGAIISTGLLINTTSPWLGFSPDGFIISDSGEKILVEIKCPIEGRHEEGENLCTKLKYLFKKNNKFCLKTQHIYYGQIQLGLTLCNLKQCKLLIYSKKSNNCVEIDVPFDEEFSKKFITSLNEIYFKYYLPYLVSNKDILFK